MPNHEPSVDFEHLMHRFDACQDNFKDLRDYADNIRERRQGLENTYLDIVKDDEQVATDLLQSGSKQDAAFATRAERFKSALDTVSALERRTFERLDELSTEKYLNNPNRYRNQRI